MSRLAGRSILDFSIYPTLRPDSLMAILRSWGDESGDSDGKSARHFGMGAVIGAQSQWVTFEGLWQKMLDDHEIPDLHMKKVVFAKNEPESSPFAKFSDRGKLDALLTDVNKCILRSGVVCRALAIISDNFSALLKQHGLGSDLYAFCLYQTVVRLGTWALNEYPDDPSFELTMDRKDKHVLREDRARRLYEGDTFASWRGWPQVNILSQHGSKGSRHILPIQAADYVAWNTRRLLYFADEWFSEHNPATPPGEWFRELSAWTMKRLDALQHTYPAEILFFNAAAQLVNQGALGQFFYTEGGLERHVIRGRSGPPPATAKAHSIARAGEYPLTP